MEILIDNEKQEKHTVWDNVVPIVKSHNKTKAFITTDIDMPDTYNELYYRLVTAEPGEEFELHLNTPGGVIDSAFMICDAIKQSKAKVTAYMTGTVASAGTIIALACDEIKASDHLSFMIHNYSGGMVGKGHEMKARQEFVDSSLNEAFKSFYNGFLTDKEMTEIIDGKDLWIGSKEVMKRWKAKVNGKDVAKVKRTKAKKSKDA